MLAPYVLHDGLVELVAGDLDGGGLHDAGQGDDRDVGGAAADVHDHVAVGLGDVDARADGGGHGLLNQIDPPGAAWMPASMTARSSTSVMPEGTQMTMRGLNSRKEVTLRMNSLSIRSVMS